MKNDDAIAGAEANARADRMRKREIRRVMDRLGLAENMNWQSYPPRYGEAIQPAEAQEVDRRA
jgi:hypothetical protein